VFERIFAIPLLVFLQRLTCCDTAEVLEAREHSFDQIALAVTLARRRHVNSRFGATPCRAAKLTIKAMPDLRASSTNRIFSAAVKSLRR
jgi:hypothetical protein